MIKRFFLTMIICVIPFFANANKNLYKDLNLSWVESIPIFPKLKVDKPNTIEFDSVNGKILVVHVFLEDNQISQMKSFYNKYFQNDGWLKLNRKKDDMVWEKKIGSNQKKQFIMKRKTFDKWALNYVVENF